MESGHGKYITKIRHETEGMAYLKIIINMGIEAEQKVGTPVNLAIVGQVELSYGTPPKDKEEIDKILENLK